MGPSISDMYRNEILPAARGDILRESEAQIIGSDIKELQKYFYEKHALTEILEDPQREASYEIEDYLQTIAAHERERFYSQEGDLRDFECQRVILEMPLVPNGHIGKLSGLKGSRYSLSYSDRDFLWSNNVIRYVIETKGYGFNLDDDGVAQEVENALRRIRETVQFKNEAVVTENIALKTEIASILNSRVKKISESKDRISALTTKISIPLKKKSVIGQGNRF